jgi:plasmid stabilization system protein ParE
VRLILTDAAKADIRHILRRTRADFGELQVPRYRALIEEARKRVCENPNRPSARGPAARLETVSHPPAGTPREPFPSVHPECFRTACGGLTRASRRHGVLVDDLSRLSRDLGDTWQIVFRDLASAGVRVIDVTTGLASDACCAARRRTWQQERTRLGHTTIRAMLRNERYIGRVTWNQSKWVRVPGRKSRRRVMRPESEWVTHTYPQLAIVSAEHWATAQARFRRVHASARDRRAGTGRYVYLISGLLSDRRVNVRSTDAVPVEQEGLGHASGCRRLGAEYNYDTATCRTPPRR